MIWMSQPFSLINRLVGNPGEILHLPNPWSETSSKIGFWDRILNVLFWLLDQILSPYVISVMQSYYDDNFPADKYSPYELARRNISLILCNHHFSEGPIRANVPGIIEIGGIQIKPKPDPLPTDIKEFLDNANENGAIIFSLGTNLYNTDLKPDTIKSVYNVLSTLEQKVIWKWNDAHPVPGNSTNILYQKWLPQDDILAHPNIRLFITHGGKGGVAEAKYHGVPMLGLPVFGDQPMNIRIVEAAGYGIGLDYQQLTESIFRTAILEVLQNPKYQENVKYFSELYRDRPMTARDTATYWIEYVIRYRGAIHLQSQAVHFTQIEYLGLDIAAFLLCCVYSLYKILWLCGKLICRIRMTKRTAKLKLKVK